MSRRKQSHPKPLKRSPEETCPEGLSISDLAVRTERPLTLGTKFGPYRARQVSQLPASDLEAYLQAEAAEMILHLEEEASFWLKFLSQAKNEAEANFRVILEGGSLWATAATDLPQGTTLRAWFQQDTLNGDIKTEPASPVSNCRRSCSPADSPPSGSMAGCRKSSPSRSLDGSPVSPGCRSDPGVNSRFTCEQCGIQYSSQSNLEAHQKFYCSKGRIAEGVVSPSRSEGRDGDNRTKPYTCSLCPFTCDRRTGLTRHLRVHDTISVPEDAPSRYCSHCDIQFSSLRTFQVHKRFYCSTRHVQKPQSSGTRSPSPSSPVIVTQPLYAAISTNPLILVPCSYKPGGNGVPSPSLLLPGANSEVVPAFTVLPSSPPEVSNSSPPLNPPKKTPPIIKSPWYDRSIKVELDENSRSCEPLDLSLKNKEEKEHNDEEITPPSRPPLIISPNCAGPSLPSEQQPRVIVKQGSSRCHECNIVFYKYENYQVHKNFYCSSRQQKLKKCSSPKANIKDESQDKENSSNSSQCRSPDAESELQNADSNDNDTPPLSNNSLSQLAYQFFCTSCGIKFTSLDNLQTHQSFYCPKREHNLGNKREIKCNKCKITYSDEESLNNHVCKKTWKCPYCDIICHSFISAQKHFQSHSTAGKVFRCTICGYKGHTLRGMRTHVRIHPEKGNMLPEESFILCTDDDFGASKRKFSQDETRDSSPIPGSSKDEPDSKKQCLEAVHSCQVCGYNSSYKGNVVRHVKLVHRELTNVGNAIDSKPIDPQKSPSSLENGVESSSSPEPLNEEIIKPGPPYCKTCDISFKYFNNFIAHKKFYCTKRTESVQ